MGAEQVNLLVREVVLLQKGEQRHRHAVPPVGVAQKNGVVSLQLLHRGGQLRPGVLCPLLIGPFQAGVPVAGIGLGDLDGEQVASRPLADPLGQLLDVARRGHAGRGHRVDLPVDDGVVRPGKIGHQHPALLRIGRLLRLLFSRSRLLRGRRLLLFLRRNLLRLFCRLGRSRLFLLLAAGTGRKAENHKRRQGRGHPSSHHKILPFPVWFPIAPFPSRPAAAGPAACRTAGCQSCAAARSWSAPAACAAR